MARQALLASFACLTIWGTPGLTARDLKQSTVQACYAPVEGSQCVLDLDLDEQECQTLASKDGLPLYATQTYCLWPIDASCQDVVAQLTQFTLAECNQATVAQLAQYAASGDFSQGKARQLKPRAILGLISSATDFSRAACKTQSCLR